MIIVRIIGGLGNQMFQYAFGKYIEKQGFKVKYDITGFHDYTLWDYKLETVFNIDVPKANNEEFNHIKDNSKNIFARLRRKVLGFKRLHIQEKTFNINELKKEKSYYLDGYWNTWKYVYAVDNIVRDKFNIPNSQLSIHSKKILSDIQNNNSVSIHFRRGDYVSNKKNYNILGVCSLEYYQTAINIISEKISNPKFYIFSDDIEWVRNNFYMPNHTIKFIEKTKDYEELALMSKCKHNIIANSTFSWWGAYLNNNKEKICIAPQHWYNHKKKNSRLKLIPPKWNSI